MKLKATLLFLLGCIFFSYSQKTTAYQKFKNEIKFQKHTRDYKLKRAVSFVSNNRLYVSELIDICNYFQRERATYRLSVNAYTNIIDKRNFFDVYNLFSSFGNAMKLYHNTQGSRQLIIDDGGFDDHPGDVVYNDCRYLSADEFNYVLQTIKDQPFSKDKKEITKQQLSKNCFSVAQIKTIVDQFSFDRDKLEVLKLGYKSVDNVNSFYTLREVLKFRSYKKQFDEFLLAQK